MFQLCFTRLDTVLKNWNYRKDSSEEVTQFYHQNTYTINTEPQYIVKYCQYLTQVRVGM